LDTWGGEEGRDRQSAYEKGWGRKRFAPRQRILFGKNEGEGWNSLLVQGKKGKEKRGK